MTQKNRSAHRSTDSQNFVTKIFGGFVGKVINIGEANTVNILRSRWFGVIALATITLTGFAAYRIFVPQHVTIDNLPKDTLVINNLPPLSSDGKQSNAEKQQAQALVQKYRQAVQQNPNDPIARTNLGETLRRVGDLAGAQREQEKALQLKPDLQAAKIGIALIQQDQGNAKDAKQELQQVLNGGESAAVYFYLGNTLDEAKDFKGAEVAYRKSLELNADLATYNNLGNVLYRQGKREEAIAQYRAAIRLDPNSSSPHGNLGVVLDEQGKHEEAIAQYQEAIRLDPSSSLPHNNLGALLAAQGKREEAIAQYRAAIRLDPNSSLPHHNLGIIMAAQGKYEEAMIQHQEAIRLDPNYADAHHALGLNLLLQNKLEKGFSELRTAKALYEKQENAEGVKQINELFNKLLP